MFNTGTINLHFYVCSNKNKPKPASIRRFEDSLRPYHFVAFQYWDLEELVAAVLERRHPPVNGIVTFIDLSYFAKSDGPLKATVAAIPAKDLIRLVQDSDDPTKINDDIFDENVRVDLGLNNSINREINESALSERNYEFWYLNNGITMVCEDCSYLPNSRSPTATLRNVQIVNGGQTTRTLFHANRANPEKLDFVNVLVRIIETGDRSISEKISETANRQTPVRTRDLRANDLVQRKLEEEFHTLGYYYERKKNQHLHQPAAKRLDSEAIGQVALAYYHDMPSEAKDQKAVVFGDQYSLIFHEDTCSAGELLFPYLLYKPLAERKREIQQKKRRKDPVTDEEAFFSLATFHILNTMKLVSGHEELDLEDEEKVGLARSKAISLIGEVVSTNRKKLGELYTHDRFFKQRTTNELIRTHVLEHYE